MEAGETGGERGFPGTMFGSCMVVVAVVVVDIVGAAAGAAAGAEEDDDDDGKSSPIMQSCTNGSSQSRRSRFARSHSSCMSMVMRRPRQCCLSNTGCHGVSGGVGGRSRRSSCSSSSKERGMNERHPATHALTYHQHLGRQEGFLSTADKVPEVRQKAVGKQKVQHLE